ncbi:uncharacterized protein LTR77_006816 [Saxophila tyrrhenica]|uniref:Uncharacterized protein n=1 Tax=Saxophila tyrrhenica TaxID=1690608 RepID=A0AAV9P5X2_9PEZI|nr:hypothetical protein LTR77_006816 [Saxophila tyrrhenica]
MKLSTLSTAALTLGLATAAPLDTKPSPYKAHSTTDAIIPATISTEATSCEPQTITIVSTATATATATLATISLTQPIRSSTPVNSTSTPAASPSTPASPSSGPGTSLTLLPTGTGLLPTGHPPRPTGTGISPSSTGTGIFPTAPSPTAPLPSGTSNPSAPSSPNPTNIPSCPKNGELLCNGPSEFGLCNWGKVVFVPVAEGTKCVGGRIVDARGAYEYEHGHESGHGGWGKGPWQTYAA